MLFSMMIILAITSTILELLLAARIPAWRKWSHASPLFNLINSLLLSFVMGIMFGAAGLVALGAGVISTLLSVPGYKVLHWNFDTPEAISVGGNRWKHIKENFNVYWTKWSVAIKDLLKLIYTIIKIITFPIWITRWIYLKLHPYMVRMNAAVDRMGARVDARKRGMGARP
jgi:hypothetical protein